ncbi:hypothetical protein E9O_06958 [Moraxella catarrhalis 12P80B1]|uniref:Uncharacterized protein n=1 Tax=Moraxella catarrhalis TaxID=480 RepID=A0A198UE95_MORCA|nr:hypothetical protein E9K_08724 [Moraxella catarrhalis 103P14B1]EGE14426.1 hypothetical protein E9O_06958 [Moraxella catarrhalis 12P80B1]OAU94317.1 hypothetical protein AO383_2223 [Moraxella catarrhalis]OAU94715.1 hypothetical protein AO384_2072 [Moraxella catarrhalis]
MLDFAQFLPIFKEVFAIDRRREKGEVLSLFSGWLIVVMQ